MQENQSSHQNLVGLLSTIELILFDVDNTILKDTHIHYWEHLNYAVEAHERNRWEDEDFIQYLNSLHFTSRHHLVATMLKEDPTKKSQTVDSAVSLFYTSFEGAAVKPALYPYISVSIANLAQLEIPLIAFSDTEARLIHSMLSSHQLTDHFESIVGEAKKPATEILHQTLSRRPSSPKVPGKNILVIGDNLKTDGRLALNANCSFIFFSDNDPKKADAFIKDKESGTIPNDSILIKNHGELLSAIDAILEQKNESKSDFSF